MEQLHEQVEPSEVGLDARRLERVDRHLAGYVDDGRLAGCLVSIARHGKVAHLRTIGRRDREADQPVEVDTLWRIFSMTKPVTAVAALTLVEEGRLGLRDPISRYLPSFGAVRVYEGGVGPGVVTRPAIEPIRVWHLLTHTAGLTYGFHHAHPVDALYRAAGFDWGTPPELDLAGMCDRLAELPLLFDPGREWNYGMSSDVLGRVVEVVADQSLDDVFAERVFGPLDMVDAGFFVAEPELGRVAAAYRADAAKKAVPLEAPVATSPPTCLLGGGGLVCSARDYHRFMEMLRCGGVLDGARVLGPRTVRTMGSNHLPGGADLDAFGRPLFAESPFEGVGFGLGVSVVIDPVKAKIPGSVGEMAWGGAASTAFWVDPVEDLTVQLLTQLVPSSTHPIRSELRGLVYQALVD